MDTLMAYLSIGLFMFIAYFIFSASRKSEQNKVWAGMAKETAHQIATPLSSLIAWIELLKNKDGIENMVIEMEKDIKRLETITDRFSKIEAEFTKLKEEFRKETRTWLEDNCPQSMRTPTPEEEVIWGGRKQEWINPDSKIWMERMAEKGWTVPRWPQ